MALVKTPKEIESYRRSGALLSKALQAAVDAVKPGVVIRELDRIAERVILEGGGMPSFKGYKSHPDDTPFPSTVCISINDEIVHGLGNRDVVLEKGDIVGLDIGCWYEGMCTDMAVTVPVGEISQEAQALLNTTKQSLFEGVKAAKIGNLISDISAAIEHCITPHGYGIIRSLVGHGVGHEVHELPHIPNFISDKYPRVEIVEGMCLALEPMVALGDWRVETAEDGWGIVMADGSLGAHFEVSVVITNKGAEIVTPLPI